MAQTRVIHTCTQEQRITSIERITEEILDKLNEQHTTSAVFAGKMEAYMFKVDEHDRALKGVNGTPGVLSVIANMQATYDDVSEALRGKGDHAGLIALVMELNRRMTEKESKDQWMNRLILGGLVTFTITQVIGLITNTAP